MFFLQATQAPVPLTIKWSGDKDDLTVYHIPKMSMDDLIEWAAELKERKIAETLDGMDEARQRETRIFYANRLEVSINGLTDHVQTAEGAKEVIARQLPKAKKIEGKDVELTVEKLEELFGVNGLGRFTGLAYDIADIFDKSTVDPFPPPPKLGLKANGEPEEGDPLTNGGKDSSLTSPATGSKTLPSSNEHIPPLVGVS